MRLVGFSLHSCVRKKTNTLPHYQQVQLSVILAKDVLPFFEQKHPNDNRPRKAIEATEAWLRYPGKKNRKKARKAADVTKDTWTASRDDSAASFDTSTWAAYAIWSAAKTVDAIAWDAGTTATYIKHSRFFHIIPNKRMFIKTLGRSR